jgi:hypothetical protein
MSVHAHPCPPHPKPPPKTNDHTRQQPGNSPADWVEFRLELAEGRDLECEMDSPMNL